MVLNLKSKILIALALVVGLACPVAAQSVIAHTSAGSTDDVNVTTSAIDTTGANQCVVAVSAFRFSAVPSSLSDSKSNSWTKLTSQVAPTAGSATVLFYTQGGSFGSSHTFTYNDGTSDFPSIAVICTSQASSSPFDVENGNSTDGNTTLQTGSVTPGSNNEWVITAFGFSGGTSTPISIDLSFTISDTTDNGAHNVGISMAYLFVSTAAAKNPTWTQNAARPATAPIATFKTSAATTTCRGLLLLGVGCE